MHVKLGVLLFLTTAALVRSEPPPETHGGGGGSYSSFGHGGSYSSGSPSFGSSSGGGYSSHSGGGGYRTKIKESGPSKIFGWLGSRFAKLPHFLPKFPQFPKYQVPHKLPSYQASIVLPEFPSHDTWHGSQEVPQNVEVSQTIDHGHGDYDQGYQHQGPEEAYQSYQAHAPAQDYIPEFKPHSTDDIEVVQSQLLSYNKEVIPPNGGWRDQGAAPAAPAPISAPPLYNHIPAPPKKPKTVVKNVPIVPHSTGPDYFDTAYAQNGKKHQQAQPTYAAPVQNYQQQQQQQQYQVQAAPSYQMYNGPPPQTYQPAPAQQYNPQGNYGAVFTDVQAQSQGYELSDDLAAAQMAGFDFGAQSAQPAPAAPPAPAPSASYGQAPHSNAAGFVSSGIPGVQILSQSDQGGNPVFEVLADANAPDFNGHPFDINKLIAMIEPGAELAGAPELSHAASESQNVYSDAPAATGDLDISGSEPGPFLSQPPPTKAPSKKALFLPKSLNSTKSSSLKEIMDFFQTTGGKGYVVVEKKRGPKLNRTDDDDTIDYDDDLTDGISRVNITADSFPSLALDRPDFLPPAPILPTAYPTVAKSPPRPLTPPPPTPSPVVFFAVRATTRHPNHNYEPAPYQGSPADPFEEDDMSFAESNIKAIAITVTPPPKRSSSTPPTVTLVTGPPTSSSNGTVARTPKNRPSPVYKPRVKPSPES